MKFDITVTETLSRKVTVETENYDEALEKVEEMYDNEEIVLDSSDFLSLIHISEPTRP